MVVSYKIHFKENSRGIYYAGQILRGTVVIKLDEIKRVKAVTLKIKGFAETRWTETITTIDNRTEIVTYGGHENYIAHKIFLLDARADNEPVTLDPGKHEYNFSYKLPITCPSSFVGSHGRVCYMIKVALVRPWRFDQTFTRHFTVLKVLNLNTDAPFMDVPTYKEIQKTYWCWPCSSDPLTLRVSLNQRGFVPGQTMPVTVLVTNDTNIRVDELQLMLTMMIRYYSSGLISSSISESFVVKRLKGDSVLRNCKKEFHYKLRVPATPATCLNLCSLIQITYQLDVVAAITGCHTNGVVHVPVSIGSVPLTSCVRTQPQPQRRANMKPQQLMGTAMQSLDVRSLEATTATEEISSASSLDETQPPPTYEQATHICPSKVFKSPTLKEESNNLNLEPENYVPLYPVFNISSPAMPLNTEATQTLKNSPKIETMTKL